MDAITLALIAAKTIGEGWKLLLLSQQAQAAGRDVTQAELDAARFENEADHAAFKATLPK